MDYEKFIIDSIERLSGKYAPYQIFTDWIAMSALAIQNSCKLIKDKLWLQREEMYKTIAAKYSHDELTHFSDMTGALSLLLEDRFYDYLGEIYMKSGCGSKNTGQFFTPYHLSYLTAKICLTANLVEMTDAQGNIEVNEPSTGGGGMMIAVAQVLKESNIDYQRRLHVIAQDLDWNGVYMTYIQLSLLGVKAIVVQGDTLAEPYHRGYEERRIFRTPAEMGLVI